MAELRRRLLSVIHYPVFGGPHNRAMRLAGPLAERGWDTTILIPDEPGNAAERLQANNVDFLTLPLGRLRASKNPATHARSALGFVPQVQRIRRLIRDRQIELVVIGGLANPHAAFAARLEGVPLAWQVVDSRTPAFVRRTLMPLVLRLADCIMFNGANLIELHCGSAPLKAPYTVYYPPVDTDVFRPSETARRETREKWGIPQDATVIGMVANLNPQKGIEYFVRAADILHRALPDARFLVVGARYGTHEAYLRLIQAEIEATGIPNEHFILAGEQRNVQAFFPAMDVSLITSVPKSEGTTTTAMESMACGVPVVATDVGSIADVVEDGRMGLVVPALRPDAIAAATLKVLRHENTLLASDALRQRAIERFDVEVCAETHVRAFEKAIIHHSTRRKALVVAALKDRSL